MYEGLKNLEVPAARKHPGARRAAKIGIVGIVVMALMAVAVGGFTYWRIKANLARGVDEQLRAVVDDVLPGDPINVLVVGTDSREGVGRAERRQGLGGPGGKRADVILVLHLAAEAKGATLVSIPRDTRVEIPGHGTNKINAALAFGGRKLMIRTVRRFTGLRINHYVEVNFFGFRGLVEAVKGVPIRTDRAISDDKAKLHIPGPGCWVLDGVQGLAYVRARQFDPTADIGRIQRQQGFMRALASRVRSKGVLLNPSSLDRISREIGEYFVYDPAFVDGATFGRARAIAAALATLDQRKLDFRIVPNYTATIGGISYVIPREEETHALFTALREDRPIPGVGQTAQSVPKRKDVTVQVLNGTRRDGMATKESRRLERRNFNVITPGNTERRKRTVILYELNDELKADLVARFFKGARLRLTNDDLPADVVVRLGNDRLAGGESPAPASEPAPTRDDQCRPLRG